MWVPSVPTAFWPMTQKPDYLPLGIAEMSPCTPMLWKASWKKLFDAWQCLRQSATIAEDELSIQRMVKGLLAKLD